MPPGPQSRYINCIGVTRISDGLTFLLEREPFRFRNHPSTIRVSIEVGDTWESLAFEYLQGLPNAEQFAWAIREFQPDPVVDPTVAPRPGSVVYIPSPELIQSEYFSDEFRDEVVI